MVGLTELASKTEQLERELAKSALEKKHVIELNKLIEGIVGADYMVIESISKMKINLNSEI